ncbi:MAG TPA: M20/M25/M40 family metallo-hydrolase [Solirubrobacteraceae bacterium]|nr:M20/M25/M40 family metallo-hydrolase [Solirubrobacteraceae bacterium]
MSAVASATERRYLNDTFAELCRIASPSGSERACAELVGRELRSLCLDVREDDAGPRAGSDCGNLLARIPARPRLIGEPARGDTAPPGVLLCAHLDTVPPRAPLEPVLVDDGWENANDGILGADNKAAIAVILALARRLHGEGSPVDVELLFTVCEERGLAGARAFDASSLRSDFGYVFDHASPIGEVVLSSPSHFRVEASFHGAAAHAGIRPEDGRSAILAAARSIAGMSLGRVDEHTTVNVGTIAGGSAMNVVPEHCTLVAEVRGHSDEQAEAALTELIDCVYESANLPECECDVDIDTQRTCAAYSTLRSAPAVRAAEHALRACGYEPTPVQSGGASDANALIAQGFTAVNLANGTERNHEPSERVSVAALEGMLDVALALPDSVVAHSSHADR